MPVQAQNGDSLKVIKAKPRPEDQIEQYFFVLLKTGPKQDFDSAQKAECLKGIWQISTGCITMAL